MSEFVGATKEVLQAVGANLTHAAPKRNRPDSKGGSDSDGKDDDSDDEVPLDDFRKIPLPESVAIRPWP